MSKKFEIKFKIDREINSCADVGLLLHENDKVDDACNCGSRGIIFCQVYVYDDNRAAIVGKFVDHDTASKLIGIIKGGHNG